MPARCRRPRPPLRKPEPEMEPAILDRIVARKREELAARRAAEPYVALERRAAAAPPPRDFRAAITRPLGVGTPRVIAEIKRASPSKGPLRPDLDPTALAAAYAAG